MDEMEIVITNLPGHQSAGSTKCKCSPKEKTRCHYTTERKKNERLNTHYDLESYNISNTAFRDLVINL